MKTSLELEQEELEKIPKFKAIPLNKKVIEFQLRRVYPILRILFFHLSNQILFFQIFESKGDIGVFCLTKKHVSEPQEFHFATDERIPPPAAMADLFGKVV